MSSKANRIRGNAEADRKLKLYTLYGTLIGSVIVTVGKLVNKTENELLEEFSKASTDEELFKCNNVREVVDYFIDKFKLENYKSNLILVYDENQTYTPIVTIMDDEGIVYPLDRDGNALGILAHLGSDTVKVEYIYD